MPEYKGVDTNHPAIVEGLRNAAKMGWSKEKAAEVIGAPREIVDREYRHVEQEKKKR